MKTPDKIKQGLAVCATLDGDCENCPYDDGKQLTCVDRSRRDALAYIIHLESRLAQVERERDAAVADIEKYKGCGTCKFQDVQNDCNNYQNCCECDNTDRPCYGALVDDCWQWRGICSENTKEQKQGEKQV